MLQILAKKLQRLQKRIRDQEASAGGMSIELQVWSKTGFDNR
jgi:hypothetical protein